MNKHIPNFITSLNLASGFIAIMFIAGGDILTGSWLILAAMIFDFLDGLSARLLKAYSELGKELDSLADVISFGVAPGFIISKLISASISGSSEGTGLFILTIVIPSIMPVCTALRLARFNIDTTQSTSFKGLPAPANGLAVISVVIANHYSDSQLFSTFYNSPTAIIILTLALSFLMVSRIPLMSLKIKNLKVKGNEGRYLLIVLVGISLIVFGLAAMPLIIPIYIIASLVSLLFPEDSK
jgi:CDP-diacylglycerol--serine O-phosphatidyltransferase